DSFLRNNKITLPKEKRKTRLGSFDSPTEFPDAIKKYKSAKAVAEYFGFTVATAYYHAEKYGLSFEKGHIATTEKLTELAYEFLESDLKLKPFAEKNGVKYQSLYQVIRKVGIDVKTKKFFKDLGEEE
ncbi:hypothetical protein, partial [Staphylococcus aureus]|uniref:hypothetical protein n=1 Tax=Staphylococcus aureus TaxID=1280 RepID=UPI0020BEB0FF